MKNHFIAALLAFLSFLPCAAFAETTSDALPHVAIAGFANKTGDDAFDTPSQTATESLALTIRRLGAYEIVASETMPAARATDAELLAWCQSASVDFVLYGSIAAAKGGAQAYDLAVFDRAKGKTTIKKMAKGSSVFDVFSCADTLTFAVIDAIAGRHVGFGSLAFEVANPGSAEGKTTVSLDGVKAAEGFGQIDRVVEGSHLVAVTWEASGMKPKTIALVEIEVTEGECASVAVTVPEAKKSQAKKTPQASDIANQTEPSGDGMVLVEGGTFTMGSDSGPMNERPAHGVTVGSFWMGKTEVTQGEYQAARGFLPKSSGSNEIAQKKNGKAYPVIVMTWFDAIEYCNALSIREGYRPVYTIHSGKVTWDKLANGFRLPTEAEWEYAAKGGIHHDSFTFPGSNDIAEVAVTTQTVSGNGYDIVAMKKPNSLGFYDLGGNVYEFCWDGYQIYAKQPSYTTSRVIRGGDSLHGNAQARCTARTFVWEGEYENPWCDYPRHNIGFRIVRSVEDGEE